MKDLFRTLFYIFILTLVWASLAPADEIEYKIDSLLKPVVRVSYKTGAGSGVVVSSRNEKIGQRNFVLTNWHVVEEAIGKNDKEEETRDLITVKNYDYAKKGRNIIECTRQARIVKCSKEFDLALLEILDRSVTLDSIALLPKTETLELFQPVWHVGFPGGQHLIFVNGIINGLEKDAYSTKVGFIPKYITTNAPIWYGSSGGLTAREIDGIFYLAAIPTLMRDAHHSKGAPYVNWCISARSIRFFLVLNNLEFVFDDKAKIPKFKIYPRPQRDFDFKIDLFIPWRKKE